MGLSLEDLIRRGARGLIQKAIEVEVKELLEEYGNVKMLGGQRAVVRNGYLRIPAQAGHGFQGKLDSDSIGSWTPIPRQAGQLSGVA